MLGRIIFAMDKRDLQDRLPEEFSLDRLDPNPCAVHTIIEYSIPQPCHVTIVIIDKLRTEVKRITVGHKQAGSYFEEIDLSSVPIGVYTVRFRAGDYIQSRDLFKYK